MNTERLKVLTNIYLDRLDEITKGESDIRERWAAISACIKKWDIDASDFGAMFDSATKRAIPLIQEGEADPRGGIVRLCEMGQAEEVREAFQALLSRSSAEGSEQQDKALRFVYRINELCKEVFPGDAGYKHHRRTALRYLALIRPNENYYFKASEAIAFAGYTEAEDEIGFDKSLNLPNYYRLCDEVANYLGTREDVMRALQKALDRKAEEIGDRDLSNIDLQRHIVTADLISSAYRFRFYEDKAANRKSKISTVSQRRIERAVTRAKLLDEREQVADNAYALTLKEEMTPVPDITGKNVRHSAFGSGVIEKQEGRYVTVAFSSAKKKFALPGAVIGGYLNFEDDNLLAVCKQMAKDEQLRKEVEKKLTSIEVQLLLLE